MSGDRLTDKPEETLLQIELPNKSALIGSKINQKLKPDANLANPFGGNVMIKNFVNNFVNDEGGQDIVEYSLLLVLIGAAAVFVLTTMGESITSIFSKINTKLTTADKSIS